MVGYLSHGKVINYITNMQFLLLTLYFFIFKEDNFCSLTSVLQWPLEVNSRTYTQNAIKIEDCF